MKNAPQLPEGLAQFLRDAEKKMNPHFSFGLPFEPPWLVFPSYEMCSMGFRMGSGEDYDHAFNRWWSEIGVDKIIAFKLKYPEPENYVGFYDLKDKIVAERIKK